MSQRARLVSVALGAVVAACGCAGASDTILVSHAFSSSAEGWLIAGDTVGHEPDFRPDGGQSGGFIAHVDEAVGETWYFSAPDSVLSQLPAAFGGSLSYSLKQSESSPGYLDDDIVIVGPEGRLSYRFSWQPGNAWTDYTVALSADAGWRWNWNAVASEDQMRRVLGNPSRLEIRGEYQTGPDEGGLDTFMLSSVEQ